MFDRDELAVLKRKKDNDKKEFRRMLEEQINQKKKINEKIKQKKPVVNYSVLDSPKGELNIHSDSIDNPMAEIKTLISTDVKKPRLSKIFTKKNDELINYEEGNKCTNTAENTNKRLEVLKEKLHVYHLFYYRF